LGELQRGNGSRDRAPAGEAPRGAAVTIADIARQAGVHPASVSRALRGIGGKVSEATRRRIVQLADELGYLPNAVAASLRTKQSKLVGVIVPDLGNPLFGPLVTGIEVELRRQGFMCLVAHTTEAPGDRGELVAALAHRQVSGLLILAAEIGDALLDAVQRYRLPAVLVNRGFGEHRFASVVNDDHESVRLVLEHLMALGHRRVAHIAGPASSSTGRVRRQAFAALCRQYKLTAQIVQAGAFTRAAGHAAATKLLDKGFTSTAVFAANDLIALGVLDALRTSRLRVPGDVSLVGHNDMPLVDLIDPPLTTVRVAAEQMSRQAAQLLLDLLGTPGQAPVTRLLLPQLIVRRSTAAPPAPARAAAHRAPRR
jgi:LacI family transcriptional regulator